MDPHKAIVIGSGPAGLSAALALAEQGIHPLILERLDRPALKLLASGGGRCNFSNCLEPEDFMRKFGRNGAFMRNAMQFAPRQWLLDFLESRKVRTVLTDSFYYFPASGYARDIFDAFASASGAEIRTSAEVTGIVLENGAVRGVELHGEVLQANCVILACGRMRMDGPWNAERVGPRPEKPDMPFCLRFRRSHRCWSKKRWVGSLSGVTLENASLTLRSGRDMLKTSGSLLFTHTGLSGFPAMDLAAEVSSLCREKETVPLLLSVKDSWDKARWSQEFDLWRSRDGKKGIRSLLAQHIPHSLADIFCDLCGCAEAKASTLSAVSRELLLEKLCAGKLTLKGAGPMEKAMAMRGGVSLKEVRPDTMESRIVQGLFFAGEVLDLVGPCGGYNIQWAFFQRTPGRLFRRTGAAFRGNSRSPVRGCNKQPARFPHPSGFPEMKGISHSLSCMRKNLRDNPYPDCEASRPAQE